MQALVHEQPNLFGPTPDGIHTLEPSSIIQMKKIVTEQLQSVRSLFCDKVPVSIIQKQACPIDILSETDQSFNCEWQ
jgi:hypothetical protein